MAESNADKAAREQAEQAAADAKVHDNAKQDTAKVSPVPDPADPSKRPGVRPATGTPAQVVEADPGIELDNDLDQAAVRRVNSAAVELEADDRLKRAQAKAPNLTQEFVAQYGLTDNDLEDIASGLVPGPPRVGPVHNVELHRTPGGWQLTPLGVPQEDAGKNAISR